MKIEHLLSRIDDQSLQILLGGPGMKLITTLDPGLATPSRLKGIVLELHSPSGLLLSKKNRNIIIEFLKPSELSNLLQILGESPSEDFESNLRKIKELNVTRNSNREQALVDFFELSVPDQEIREIKSSRSPTVGDYMLFPHQREAVIKIKNMLNTPPRRVLLHMPTGSGKTRTTMNVIAEHLRNNEPTVVVWLAYSEELCEQAASEFEKAWKNLGDRELETYRFWGPYDIEIDQVTDGLLVAGLSKMFSTVKKNIKIIGQIGTKTSLVIIDEAHSAIAETYKLVLDALVVHHSTTGLLGLSATPGRTWDNIDKDQELADYFAKQKVTLRIEGHENPIDYLVNEGYLAKVEYSPLFSESGLSLTELDLKQLHENLDISKYILKKLAESEKRNLKIILRVEELAKKHKRILVFATTVEHSDLIATILRARGYDAKSVTGKTSNIARTQAINEYKAEGNDGKILCNFGVLTTGFDAPKTSAALIARPTKSLVLFSQMVGRAIRGVRAGGNKVAEIVTVVDQELPGFGSVAEAFINWEDVWKDDNDNV